MTGERAGGEDPADRTIVRARSTAGAGGAEPGEAGAPAAMVLRAAGPLLDVLARVRDVGAVADAGALHGNARSALGEFAARARAAGVPADQVGAITGALAAALDDAVLATAWGAASGWAQRTLAGRPASGDDVFALVARARAALPATRALAEVLFHILSLGYLGRYREVTGGGSSVERIRRELGAALLAHQAPPGDLSPAWRGVHAPWRRRRRGTPAWAIAAAGLALAGVAYLVVAADLAARTAAVVQRAAAAPPARMPDLVYGAPAAP